MPVIIQQIILQLVLILINSFFAATEIAVISLNANKVRARAEEGDKKAGKMLKMLENPTAFLSTIQVGITLAGFLGSAFAADNFAGMLTDFLARTFNIADGYISVIDTVSVVVITLILSYFTLVLGELVPKRIAMRHQEKLANAVCGVISALNTVLKPIVWFLTVSTNGVLRLFGIDPHASEEPVSEEDIVLMLDAGAEEGTLNEDDIEYIKNVFKLDKLTAADVMTPRNAMQSVSADATNEEIVQLIDECGYSRIPVYDESFERITGILHSRDFLLQNAKGKIDMDEVVRKPVYVPETASLDALFKDMQENHLHIVIVIDEYGDTAGLVTMEDILEEIVGEIWDEQDEEFSNIEKIDECSYKVLTNVTIDEFFAFFELDFDDEIESTTVNGWIAERCGAIPEKDFSFDYENITVTVTKADELRSYEIVVSVRECAKKDAEREADITE